MAKIRTCSCQECGEAMQGRNAAKKFCSQTCRLRFNNRRLQRGAELYDLFMAMRYEREDAKQLGVWGLMCRMAQQMREEDNKEREGRKSWRPPAEALANRPDLHAVRMSIVPRR